MSELDATLEHHARAWEERPLLRALYRDWYARIGERLVPGRTVELGSGIGKLAEVVPHAEPTDVAETRWSSRVVDGENLPYESGSLANLVLVDVFHHLARPRRFLDEAARVLSAHGRIVLLEPHCSPLARAAYARWHHETLDLDADPFGDDDRLVDDPLAGNLARSTRAFFDCADELEGRWPFRVLERRRLAVLAYPLSGGFTKRPLLPRRAVRPVLALERVLERPLAPLCAFRLLVVVERAGL